jgi:hypothetical protein
LIFGLQGSCSGSKLSLVGQISKSTHPQDILQKMGRGDISRKIEKSHKGSTLRGHHGTSKSNIKNPFYQIVVFIPEILHAKTEEDPLENKNWFSDYSQDQFMSAIFIYLCLK